MKQTLLISAPSLSEMKAAIAKFYCGCEKLLKETGTNEWSVNNLDGSALKNCRVIRRRGRYRFEMLKS